MVDCDCLSGEHRYNFPMYIEAGPNRDSPPAILLRESYREAGKVKKRTLLNLSDWPHERIAGFKALLKGGTVIPKDHNAITIIRSLPHGHVDLGAGVDSDGTGSSNPPSSTGESVISWCPSSVGREPPARDCRGSLAA